MSISDPLKVKRGDKVRHIDGTDGVAMSVATGGTIQVKTTKGTIVSWSVHETTIIEDET